ncbi:MAG: DUF3095 family protein [Alphaproteobacteria bacterium]|nr:DUF3095 family protein [Alphaproteobacteria bacterium]
MIARETAGLDLRVAAIPVADLRRAGADLRVAKLQLSLETISPCSRAGESRWRKRSSRTRTGSRPTGCARKTATSQRYSTVCPADGSRFPPSTGISSP